MAQNFRETARLNGDDEKFENNMDKIKKLSRALKATLFFAGSEITLKEFAETYPEKFESALKTQLNKELRENMELVHVHIIQEGN